MPGPIATAVLTMLGERAFSELIDRFSGSSPAEQALQQQVAAGQAAIPTLQAQARGEPTAATKAIERRLQGVTTRAQQAYGASQRRASGTATGTPSRAQLGRLQTANIEALGQELGAAQRQATGTLAAMGVGATTRLSQLEQQKAGAYSDFIGNIGTIYGEYQNMKRTGERDDWYENIYNELLGIYKSVFGGGQAGATGGGGLTAWEREVRSRPLDTL